MNGMHVSGACPWCGQTDPSKAGRHPTGGRCNNPWHADHPEHRPNVRPISGPLTSPLEDHFIVALETIMALDEDVADNRTVDKAIEIAHEALDIATMHVEHRRIHGQLDVSAVSGGGPNWEEMIDQRNAEIERLRAEIERLVERDSKRQELLDELNRHMAGCPYAHNEWWCMCPPDQPDPECIYEHS